MVGSIVVAVIGLLIAIFLITIAILYYKKLQRTSNMKNNDANNDANNIDGMPSAPCPICGHHMCICKYYGSFYKSYSEGKCKTCKYDFEECKKNQKCKKEDK